MGVEGFAQVHWMGQAKTVVTQVSLGDKQERENRRTRINKWSRQLSKEKVRAERDVEKKFLVYKEEQLQIKAKSPGGRSGSAGSEGAAEGEAAAAAEKEEEERKEEGAGEGESEGAREEPEAEAEAQAETQGGGVR